MKKLIFFLALLPAIPAWAGEANDTTLRMGNKKIVVSESGVETRIQVYDSVGNQLVKTHETSFVDGQEVEQVFVSSPFVPIRKKKGRTFYSHFPDVFIGTNLINGGSAAHSRDTRSSEWGLSTFEMGISLSRGNTFGLVSALLAGYIHNHFNTGYVLDNIDGQTALRANNAENVRTSFLKYAYVKLPVMVEWKRRFGRSEGYVALGLSGELRGSEKSKYRIRHDKHTVNDDLNMNTLGLNLEGYIGFRGFTLYGHYALTKLFKNGLSCHPFGIGIGFSL